jgi:hypothetical protein
VHNIPPCSPSYTFSLYPPPKQNLFYHPVHSWKQHFCLFKIAMQGVLLWHFHGYMCYNPNCFIPSIFLLSASVPFLWWFQQV